MANISSKFFFFSNLRLSHLRTSASFFPKTISAWNGLAFAEAPSLAVFSLDQILLEISVHPFRIMIIIYIIP